MSALASEALRKHGPLAAVLILLMSAFTAVTMTIIREHATVKLAGGVAFAPGGTGGLITFFRPSGSSAIYETSRLVF